MRNIVRAGVIIGMILTVTAFAAFAHGKEEETDEIEQIISEMTLEEKTAQLFFVVPDQLAGEAVTTGEPVETVLDQYPVGGFILMEQNLENVKQTRELIESIQKTAEERIGITMFIAVDEEGGRVSKVAANPAFGIESIPSMRETGETRDVDQAYQVGLRISEYLSESGFNMDFAPVADVLTNPENTVIGDRSFGSDPDLVSDMVKGESMGMLENGVIPVLKHFPGHGGTHEDTHEELAYTEKTLQQLAKAELVPFAENIADGAKMIMVSHISCPEITGDDTPASLSSIMIEEILRKKLGFQGVVITDALNMGAIANHHNAAQAAVEAIQAGNDMLLMPENFQDAYNGIITAVKTGILSEERINESVKRILSLKAILP